MTYRLWVNNARTVRITLWEDGTMEYSTRANPDDPWNPSIVLHEEFVPS